MKSLKNKVAIVTGSARGLGQAIAERYASLGADIVINYSKDKAAAEKVVNTIKEYGVRVISVQADISNRADVERLFNEAKKAFGKIDIVVANAGIELVQIPMADVTEEQYNQLFSTNTKGAFLTMQFAAKHVADFGRILYIGSTSAQHPVPGFSLYGSSKSAPLTMVQILAQEIGHRGIAVNAITPTAIDGAGVFTNLPKEDQLRDFVKTLCPMGRMGTTKDVADVAEFFASDLCGFVSGQHLKITGGGLG